MKLREKKDMYVKELLSSRSFSLDASSSPRLAAPDYPALHCCVFWQTRLQAPAGFSGERITTFFVSTQKKRSQVSNRRISSGRKEGRKDRRISVILHETPETLKSKARDCHLEPPDRLLVVY